MRKRLSTILTLLIAACLFATPPLAMAQTKAIDKAQAIKKAQQRVKGRVLKVDQQNSKYRVKMLQKSGRVISVDVDKRSGKVTAPPKKKDH